MYINDLPFRIGAFRARMLVSSIGDRCFVHHSLVLKAARKVRLGRSVEIRRGVELDARSKEKMGIIIGDSCRIKEYCTIAAYGGQIKIGQSALIGRNATIFGHGKVEIGDHSMLGPNVCIFSSEHIIADAPDPFQNQGFTRERTVIGNNVWLGAGAIVLAGVQVSDNVVIAAGSVVSSSIVSPGIYGGIPAKRIADLPAKDKIQKEVYSVDWTLNG